MYSQMSILFQLHPLILKSPLWLPFIAYKSNVRLLQCTETSAPILSHMKLDLKMY